MTFPIYIDIRMLPRLMYSLLNLLSQSDIGQKRLIIAAIDDFDPKAFLDLVKARRPELVSRLIKVELRSVSSKNVPYDLEHIEKVIGMKKEDFTRFVSP